jgi:hypothetical protein
MTSHGLVRIVFILEKGAWHGSATERLWADDIGDGRYRVRNSPFFAFGISTEDIIFAIKKDGQLYFEGVSIRGGHSTYRLRLKHHKRDNLFERHWLALQDMGCTYEEGVVLVVDVPPQADIDAVYKALESGEAAGVWEFEEGHCGHLTNKHQP